MSVLNHKEALELAHYQKENSNLSRCYIDLTEQLSASQDEALEQSRLNGMGAEREEKLASSLAASKAREEAYRAEIVKLSGELSAKDAKIAAAHGLLRESRESIEWIRDRSENQRVWGGKEWKWPFPHKQIFDRATEAMEAIDKELK